MRKIKVRRRSKAKVDNQAEMPLQLIEEAVVIAAISDNSNIPRKKRKEDASKPLYLKRI